MIRPRPNLEKCDQKSHYEFMCKNRGAFGKNISSYIYVIQYYSFVRIVKLSYLAMQVI